MCDMAVFANRMYYCNLTCLSNLLHFCQKHQMYSSTSKNVPIWHLEIDLEVRKKLFPVQKSKEAGELVKTVNSW